MAVALAMATLLTSVMPGANDIPWLKPVTAHAAVTVDDSVSLKYVDVVAANTAGSVLRVYGDADTTYSKSINISANCTVVLDNVKTTGNINVSAGVTATIILRGSSRVSNISALGSKTQVNIEGEDGSGSLTTSNIAYASGQSKDVAAQQGANVSIKNCTVVCSSLGSSGNGTAWTEGTYPAAYGAAGGSASAQITITNATVSVSGSMACGGNGAATTGYYSVKSGAGGNAGKVKITGSYVSVGGSMACGGAGSGSNIGYMGGSYSDGGKSATVEIDSSDVTVKGSVAIGGRGADGTTWSYNGSASCFTGGASQASSNVTITNGSNVNVSGNVATAQARSSFNVQAGLNGATVTVKDSKLTASDIGSGSAGGTTSYSASSGGSTTGGSAGGAGGSLIAVNAEITCKTAVNGADAYNGSYAYTYNYGTNYCYDGKGGYLNLKNTVLNTTGNVGQRGTVNAANEYKGAYSDSYIMGGTVKGGGTVYGGVITTDLTSFIVSKLSVGTDIRNSEEASLAKCTFNTTEDMADKKVSATANNLSASNILLNETGQWSTYLAVGKESVKLTGEGVFSGTYMVKRSASLNVFTLDSYGIVDVTYDSAVVYADHYEYIGETYEYAGEYIVRGTSNTSDITVKEGIHSISMTDVTMDTFTVKSGAKVTLTLNGANVIRAVNVESGAILTVLGTGSLNAKSVGNEKGSSGDISLESGDYNIEKMGSSDGSGNISLGEKTEIEVGELTVNLKDADGKNLYLIDFVVSESGNYILKIGKDSETIVVKTGEHGFSKMLQEGTYEVEITKGELKYRGTIVADACQEIYLDDLPLYVDVSKGNIEINDDSIKVGSNTYLSNADVILIQSGEAHSVTINKKDAYVTLDGVAPNVQIYLPDDFNGIIADAAGAPIQVVKVHTPFVNKTLELILDGKSYSVTTNAEGDFTFTAVCTEHEIEIKTGGASFKSKTGTKISASNNSFDINDFLCYLDVSGSNIRIGDESFNIGNGDVFFTGDYVIVQTGENHGTITVTGDCSIALDPSVNQDVDIRVPDDYKGSLTDTTGNKVIYKTVRGLEPYTTITVIIDGNEQLVTTDADGAFSIRVSEGTTEIYIIEGNMKYRYIIENGVVGAKELVGPTALVVGETEVFEGSQVNIFINALASMPGNGLEYEWYKDGELIVCEDSVVEPQTEMVPNPVGDPADNQVQFVEVATESAITRSITFEADSVSEPAVSVDNVSEAAITTPDGINIDPEPVSESAIEVKPIQIEENILTISCFTANEEGRYTVLVKESNGAVTEETFELKLKTVDIPTEEPEEESTGGEESSEDNGNKPSDNSETGNSSGSDTPSRGENTSGGSNSGNSSSGNTSGGGMSGGGSYYPGSDSGNSSGGYSGDGNSSSESTSGGGTSNNATKEKADSASKNSSSGGSTSGSATISEEKGKNAEATTEATSGAAISIVKPTIKISSNLKGLKLIKTSKKNTYKLKKKGNLKITVKAPKKCTVYYKIVEKGKVNTKVKWKKLKGTTLTIKPASKYKRVYFKVKAPNGKTLTRKTTGFKVNKKATKKSK